MSKITSYILAGGKNSRLNYQNKAMLEINGKACIKYVIEALSPITNECVIIGDSFGYKTFKLRQISDIYKDMGPISGIYSGLLDSKTEWNIFVACDLPLIKSEIFSYLISQRVNADVVYPIYKGQAHYMLVLIKKSTYNIFHEQIKMKQLSLWKAYERLSSKRVNITKNLSCYSEEIFFNMNTKEDYKRVCKLLIKQKK